MSFDKVFFFTTSRGWTEQAPKLCLWFHHPHRWWYAQRGTQLLLIAFRGLSLFSLLANFLKMMPPPLPFSTWGQCLSPKKKNISNLYPSFKKLSILLISYLFFFFWFSIFAFVSRRVLNDFLFLYLSHAKCHILKNSCQSDCITRSEASAAGELPRTRS